MKSTTQYFSHDYNSFSDIKIEAMISDYGINGYGMYWFLVEKLYQESGHKICKKKYVMKAFAHQMSISAEQVLKFIDDCISEYELFTESDGYFFSDRILRNIERRDSIIEKRKKAGRISAESRRNSTSAEQVLTSVEHNSTKESKLKEIKGNEIKGNNENNGKIPFENFWDLYDKKVGKKEKIEKKWNKLKLKTQQDIISYIYRYKNASPEKQYRKNPESFLNQETWKDEIIERGNKPKEVMRIG